LSGNAAGDPPFFFFLFFEKDRLGVLKFKNFFSKFQISSVCRLAAGIKFPNASTTASRAVIIASASISAQYLLTKSIGFPVVGTVFPKMARLDSWSQGPVIPNQCEAYKNPSPHFSLFTFHFFFLLSRFSSCAHVFFLNILSKCLLRVTPAPHQNLLARLKKK
jgi:hypothetical protein